MNKQLLVAAVLLLSTTAFGQNTSVSQIERPTAISSEGFRVSLLRSDLSFTAEGNFFGENFKMTTQIDRTIGLSLGYVSLPIEQIGWTTSQIGRAHV